MRGRLGAAARTVRVCEVDENVAALDEVVEEVDPPAVLRDEDRTVRSERAAIGTTARLGEAFDACGLGPDAEERTGGDTRDDKRLVLAPHRAFAERDAVADNLRLHRRYEIRRGDVAPRDVSADGSSAEASCTSRLASASARRQFWRVLL